MALTTPIPATVEPEATTPTPTPSPPRVQKRPSAEALPDSPKKQRLATTPKKQRTILSRSPLSPPRKHVLSLRIKKLSARARIPTRGSALAAGYDLYSAHNTIIPKRGKALVDTDIQMMIPVDTYGRIAPRSGLASKNFIDVGAGVIDADYRGQVKILLFNHSDVDFEVKEGDRVAQLILERIYTPDVIEVDDLEESIRGAAGFGSTGVSVAA